MDFRIAIVILLVTGVLSSYLFLVPAVQFEQPQKQCTQKIGLVPVACVPDGTLYKRLTYCEAV